MVEQLASLSGVGPKVAACVALFSCDQHAVVPVDTHVWALACKYYLPAMKGKTLGPKLHPAVMQARRPPPDREAMACVGVNCYCTVKEAPQQGAGAGDSTLHP